MSEKEKPDGLEDAVLKGQSKLSPEEVNKKLEELGRPSKRGDCQMCGGAYDIQIGVFQHHGIEYTYQPCPSCEYNPKFEEIIEKTIEGLAEFTIRSGNVPIKVNSKELSTYVVDKLKDYWPKPK